MAKDNRAYQELFGGESMVVLFTVPEGKTLVDLFTAGNVAQMDEMESTLRRRPGDRVGGVARDAAAVDERPHRRRAPRSEILARTIERDPDADSARRCARPTPRITTLRLGAAGEQSLDNPDWVKFLLFDNTGFSVDADNQVIAPADDALMVRKALRAFMPDPRHAVLAAVLVGNAPLDDLAAGLRRGEGRLRRAHVRQRDGRSSPARRRSSPTSTTTCRAACSRSAASPCW